MNSHNFPLNQQLIRELIPHAGDMCLLDAVLSADENSIECSSTSQLAVDNPLRKQGKLSALCGIEYAAQAMAIHGGLTAQTLNVANEPKHGYIVALSAIDTFVDTLESYECLYVYCERLMATPGGSKYNFKISAHRSNGIDSVDNSLVEGSALVSLAA